MKSFIDSLVMAIYIFAIAAGGKYSLSYIAEASKKMALNKVVKGLEDLEPATQRMTGKKLSF